MARSRNVEFKVFFWAEDISPPALRLIRLSMVAGLAVGGSRATIPPTTARTLAPARYQARHGDIPLKKKKKRGGGELTIKFLVVQLARDEFSHHLAGDGMRGARKRGSE